MEYVIKSNVPDMGIAAKSLYSTKDEAIIAFKGIYKKLSQKCPPNLYLRNEESDNVRGTIQVYVDGFCYYVELFMSMTADSKKGRGRPKKTEATTNLNFRIEKDILEWIDANKGDKSRNQFINDTLRNITGI